VAFFSFVPNATNFSLQPEWLNCILQRPTYFKEIDMLQQIVKTLWKSIQKILGIADPEYVWKWIGENGSPSWSLGFWFDSFNYQAVLQPSANRPASIGLFVDYPCMGSIDVGNGVHYLPALKPAHRLSELLESGMSKQMAERTLKREIRSEMSLTDEFEMGVWQAYKLIVMVKRGRTVLAIESVDGLKVDPHQLMLGGELHVTSIALSHRVSLRDAALLRLKDMSHAVIHFQ
jgi:hypothetical protein